MVQAMIIIVGSLATAFTWQAELAPKEMAASDMRNRHHVHTAAPNKEYILYTWSPYRVPPPVEEITLAPSLLPGEAIITQADHVLRYNTYSERKAGISGALFCTNFKLAFVTTEQFPSNLAMINMHLHNQILGENDICLLNIQAINHGKLSLTLLCLLPLSSIWIVRLELQAMAAALQKIDKDPIQKIYTPKIEDIAKIDMDPEQQLYTPKIEDIAVIEMYGDI
ncbi:MTMR12 [Cordylochernes scorpioides]|uniref:MTMR12 n=1 Tax=Cordylochernes scorpioides TaxID=51811 RepID=A0ABY6K3N3_9ARAC|nr:MTMR12 [Cordylochernes scorpioides]